MSSHVVSHSLPLQRASSTLRAPRRASRCCPNRSNGPRTRAVLGPETALIATSAASTVELAASSAQMLAAGGAQNAVMQLAELSPETAATIAAVFGPFLSIAELAFILRIVMSWYPDVKDTELPWSIVFYPTEPLLAPTRRVIAPVGGVDVTPVVWFALLSFLNEILLGRQGLLVLLSEKTPVV